MLGVGNTFVFSRDAALELSEAQGHEVLALEGRQLCALTLAGGIKPLSRDSVPKELDGIARGMTISHLAQGAHHGLAVTNLGALYVWGDNSCSQLGCLRSKDHESIVPKERGGAAPAVVEHLAGHSISCAAAGDLHSLALTADGGVYAWGSNSKGQCGIGAADDVVPFPRYLGGLHGTRIVGIAAGASFSIALSDTGVVFSFGEGLCGQLGIGRNVTSCAKPQPVVFDLPTALGAVHNDPSAAGGEDQGEHDVSTRIIAISAGAAHVVARSSSGHVFTWGLNSHGQLGSHDFGARSAPFAVRHAESALAAHSVNRVHAAVPPLQAGRGGGKKAAVGLRGPLLVARCTAAGKHHSAAVEDQTGLVYVWGSDVAGQLGLNAGTGHQTDAVIPVSDRRPWSAAPLLGSTPPVPASSGGTSDKPWPFAVAGLGPLAAGSARPQPALGAPRRPRPAKPRPQPAVCDLTGDTRARVEAGTWQVSLARNAHHARLGRRQREYAVLLSVQQQQQQVAPAGTATGVESELKIRGGDGGHRVDPRAESHPAPSPALALLGPDGLAGADASLRHRVVDAFARTGFSVARTLHELQERGRAEATAAGVAGAAGGGAAAAGPRGDGLGRGPYPPGSQSDADLFTLAAAAGVRLRDAPARPGAQWARYALPRAGRPGVPVPTLLHHPALRGKSATAVACGDHATAVFVPAQLAGVDPPVTLDTGGRMLTLWGQAMGSVCRVARAYRDAAAFRGYAGGSGGSGNPNAVLCARASEASPDATGLVPIPGVLVRFTAQATQPGARPDDPPTLDEEAAMEAAMEDEQALNPQPAPLLSAAPAPAVLATYYTKAYFPPGWLTDPTLDIPGLANDALALDEGGGEVAWEGSQQAGAAGVDPSVAGSIDGLTARSVFGMGGSQHGADAASEGEGAPAPWAAGLGLRHVQHAGKVVEVAQAPQQSTSSHQGGAFSAAAAAAGAASNLDCIVTVAPAVPKPCLVTVDVLVRPPQPWLVGVSPAAAALPVAVGWPAAPMQAGALPTALARGQALAGTAGLTFITLPVVTRSAPPILKVFDAGGASGTTPTGDATVSQTPVTPGAAAVAKSAAAAQQQVITLSGEGLFGAALVDASAGREAEALIDLVKAAVHAREAEEAGVVAVEAGAVPPLPMTAPSSSSSFAPPPSAGGISQLSGGGGGAGFGGGALTGRSGVSSLISPSVAHMIDMLPQPPLAAGSLEAAMRAGEATRPGAATSRAAASAASRLDDDDALGGGGSGGSGALPTLHLSHGFGGPDMPHDALVRFAVYAAPAAAATGSSSSSGGGGGMRSTSGAGGPLADPTAGATLVGRSAVSRGWFTCRYDEHVLHVGHAVDRMTGTDKAGAMTAAAASAVGGALSSVAGSGVLGSRAGSLASAAQSGFFGGAAGSSSKAGAASDDDDGVSGSAGGGGVDDEDEGVVGRYSATLSCVLPDLRLDRAGAGAGGSSGKVAVSIPPPLWEAYARCLLGAGAAAAAATGIVAAKAAAGATTTEAEALVPAWAVGLSPAVRQLLATQPVAASIAAAAALVAAAAPSAPSSLGRSPSAGALRRAPSAAAVTSPIAAAPAAPVPRVVFAADLPPGWDGHAAAAAAAVQTQLRSGASFSYDEAYSEALRARGGGSGLLLLRPEVSLNGGRDYIAAAPSALITAFNPVFSHASPACGPAAGGFDVTVRGRGIVDSPQLAVRFVRQQGGPSSSTGGDGGGSPAASAADAVTVRATFVDSSTIRCVVPPLPLPGGGGGGGSSACGHCTFSVEVSVDGVAFSSPQRDMRLVAYAGDIAVPHNAGVRLVPLEGQALTLRLTEATFPCVDGWTATEDRRLLQQQQRQAQGGGGGGPALRRSSVSSVASEVAAPPVSTLAATAAGAAASIAAGAEAAARRWVPRVALLGHPMHGVGTSVTLRLWNAAPPPLPPLPSHAAASAAAAAVAAASAVSSAAPWAVDAIPVHASDDAAPTDAPSLSVRIPPLQGVLAAVAAATAAAATTVGARGAATPAAAMAVPSKPPPHTRSAVAQLFVCGRPTPSFLRLRYYDPSALAISSVGPKKILLGGDMVVTVDGLDALVAGRDGLASTTGGPGAAAPAASPAGRAPSAGVKAAAAAAAAPQAAASTADGTPAASSQPSRPGSSGPQLLAPVDAAGLEVRVRLSAAGSPSVTLPARADASGNVTVALAVDAAVGTALPTGDVMVEVSVDGGSFFTTAVAAKIAKK